MKCEYKRVLLSNVRIYPCFGSKPEGRIDCPLPISDRTTESQYLGLLRERLPGFLDSIGSREPIGLAIYNAGTDVFEDDPLGGLHVSANGVLERDLYVVDQLRRRGIPTLMLPSGGYTQTGYQLLVDSAVALVRRYGEVER